MAHEGIYATSAECIHKLGKNYNSTDVNEARINELMVQIEGTINVAGRKVFAADATAFTALSTTVKGILSLISASYVGMSGIMYDMSGFTTRSEAESMVTVNRDIMLMGLSLLKDKKMQTFLEKA